MTDARARATAIALLAALPLTIAGLGIDARARRASRDADAPTLAVLAPRLPTSDLALSGGARWLRAVSVEEPGAAFADGPALPDPDPAGGAMAPPTDVWRAIEERSAAATRGKR